ncbi:MAG: ATP-binding protein [Thiobacillus sp.]
MFERPRALLRTTAMRLALRQALLLVLALAVMLAALFVVLDRYTADQIDSALQGEARALSALPAGQRAQSIALLARLRSDRQLRHYRLEDAAGQYLAGNLSRWPEGLRADGRVRRLSVALPQEEEGDHDTRAILPIIGLTLPDGGRLLIAQAPGEIDDLRELALGLAAAMIALAALLALLMGVALGRQWLARIEAINTVAGRIASGDLTQRMQASSGGDEFDLLAGHLNAMLERIEAAVRGMREVSDHVAHDLRRPLARLKTRIEVALRQPRDSESYRGVLEESLQDSEEILTTFEALLTIARLEAGSELMAKATFDLAAVARDVTELYAAEAEETGRPFALTHAESAPVSGASALLAQALANLIDNAFKHTPADTPVEIALAQSGGYVELAVSDHGSGLSSADKTRLVERFARGDTARSTPGSGLGLSLVRAIAHAHGGKLVLEDTPGGGLTARLILPLSKEPYALPG